MAAPSAETVRRAVDILLTGDGGHRLPITDLAGSKQRAELISSSLTAIQNALRQELAPVNRRINDFVPLHNLPFELLSKILFHALPYPGLWKQTPRLKELSLVCSRWFDIVKSAPELWSYINAWEEVCSPPSGMAMALRKSGTTALEVTIDRPEWHQGSLPLETSQMELRSHSKRWRSLHISSGSAISAADLGKFVNTPTPILRDLQAQFYLGVGSSVPAILLELQDVKSLRNVHLATARLRWDGLSSLTSFHLGRLRDNLPSFPQFHAILAASPGLRRFSIHDLGPDDELDSSDPRPTFPTILLYSLTSLQLHSVPFGLANFIASTIRAPALEVFKVLDVSGLVLAEGHNSPLIPLLQTSISNAAPSIVTILDWAHMTTLRVIASRGVQLRFDVHPEDRWDFLKQIGEILHAVKAVTSTELHITTNNDSRMDFPTQVIDNLAGLCSISLDDLTDAIEFMDILSDPAKCPELVQLNFAKVEDLDQSEVDAFREARWGEADGDTPKKLVKFKLPNGLR